MPVPEAGDAIDDGQGLEQPIAVLQSPIAEGNLVGGETVEQQMPVSIGDAGPRTGQP